MNYDQSTQLTQKNWITFSSNERRKVHTVTNPMLHVLFSIEFFVCFPFLVSFWIFFYFHCYKVNVEKRWQHFTHKNRGWEIKHKNRSLCQDSDPKMVCNVLLFYYSTKCRWLLEKKAATTITHNSIDRNGHQWNTIRANQYNNHKNLKQSTIYTSARKKNRNMNGSHSKEPVSLWISINWNHLIIYDAHIESIDSDKVWRKWYKSPNQVIINLFGSYDND